MSTSAPSAWHADTPHDVMRALETSEQGLAPDDAAARLDDYGPNELHFTEEDPWWVVVWHQFQSPIIGILALAAVVTAFLRHWADAIAIACVLILNAAVGFWQEMRAAREVKALQGLAVQSSRVRRDDRAITIDSREIVPGDIVILASGDRVPADVRIIFAHDLMVDESMLTGENFPVRKSVHAAEPEAGLGDQTSMVFNGTLVTKGRAQGVVTATAAQTELGKINEMIQGPEGKTPLEVLMHSLEKRIGIVVGSIAVLVFGLSLATGNTFEQSFLTSVALAVAAIPEALPVVLTIAMALGVRKMARVHALVRRLPAVETLGSTSTIGSDKTGTLTQNLLTIDRVWTYAGTELLRADEADAGISPLAQQALRAGALTNEATPDDDARSGFTGDAVDIAIAAAAVTFADVKPEDITATPERSMNYESEHRYSQTVRKGPDGRYTLYVKGAPDQVLSMASSFLTEDGPTTLDPAAVLRANDDMAHDAMRVLATACADLGTDPTLPETLEEPSDLMVLGLQGMYDPPRSGVKQAIADCRTAGIRVLMITGDHPATAQAIADQLGIPSDNALTGTEIAALEDDELLDRLHHTGVAARVTPKDKLRIVELLRRDGDTVAVTGDGVNDAPALKAASIGVAMGRTGTEVSREAADIVLTDDNFVTIVEAVRQGRVTFAAIQKATFFLLSTALAVLLAVTANSVSDLPLLFLPIQVLWINVVTSGLQDVALATEPAEGGELTRKPRRPTEGLLNRPLWMRTAISGVWIGIITLISFRMAINAGWGDVEARTFALTMLVSLNFFQAINARTNIRSIFTLNPFTNWLLLVAATGSFLFHWIAMSWEPVAGVLGLEPLSAQQWGWCLLVGTSVLVVVETDKWIRRRLEARQ